MQDLHEKREHGSPSFPFAVYPCSFEVNRKGTPLHWHEEMEVLYIVSGSGFVNAQGKHITVEAGDVVLISPQMVHGIDHGQSSDMTHYALLFRPSMLGSGYAELLLDQERRLPNHLPKGSPLNSKLSPLILDLSLNRKRVDSDYSLMILSQLYALAYYIVHDSQEWETLPMGRHTNYDKLKVVLEYLRDNFAQETSVEAAAAMCGFSPSHFMKLFRELTGTSFAQYVKNLRLDTAAKLLRTTGKRVSDIAEEVGFHNLPYFTRAFGEKYKTAPSTYREQSAQTGAVPWADGPL